MTAARNNPALDAFVERARAVSLSDYAEHLSGLKMSGTERVGPCPHCGGRDRFSINILKGVWHCRGCDTGGGDAISLAAHALGLPTKSRAGFLEACSQALGGEPVPEGETDPAETARLKAEAARARDAASARTAEKDKAAETFRAREIARCRSIIKAALPFDHERAAPVRDYLAARGVAVPGVSPLLRCAPLFAWRNGLGGDVLHKGPVMVGRFWSPETRETNGVHLTWIDLARPPKFRPLVEIADPETGELAPAPMKKMRGAVKACVIPLLGRAGSSRWLGGEGVETVLAVARAEAMAAPERFAETFYFAFGSLGNLAGPGDPSSRFLSEAETFVARDGSVRKKFIPGPVPGGVTGVDCPRFPDHVERLVLLADGDSSREFTASAMVRARRRHAVRDASRPARSVVIVWPGEGDWADRLQAARAAAA